MGEIRIIEILIDNGPCYIKDGPVCYCGRHDWIIKPNGAVCSNCGKERNGHFTGYIMNGPTCYCGYHDWFASSTCWVCSNCAREK